MTLLRDGTQAGVLRGLHISGGGVTSVLAYKAFPGVTQAGDNRVKLVQRSVRIVTQVKTSSSAVTPYGTVNAMPPHGQQ